VSGRWLLAGIAASLLLVSASGASGPAEVEAEAQRVTVPEAGLSLQVPGGWDHQVRMHQLDVETVLQRLEGFDTPWLVAEAWAPTRFPHTDGCALVFAEASGPSADLAANDLLQPEASGLWRALGLETTVSPSLVALPAGDAALMEVVEERADSTWHESTYVLPSSHGLAWLRCLGHGTRRGDEWSALARSLELVAGGPQPPAAPSLELPAGWSTRAPTPWELLPVPGGVAGQLRPLLRPWLLAEADDGPGTCLLMDQAAAHETQPLDVADVLKAAVDAANSEAGSTIVTDGVIELPRGPAAYLETRGPSGETIGTYYLLDRGSRWIYLQCLALDPPSDRWRSLAQTMAYAPAD
jgi:hypothetical protein